MTFDQIFKNALREYLRRHDVDATEVTGWAEDSRVIEYGYCSTCAYSETDYTVDITYRTAGMAPVVEWLPNWQQPEPDRTYTYSGSFSALLNELVHIGKELDEDPSG